MALEDVADQVLRVVPAATGATYAWLTFNEWVAVITTLYVVLQAAYLIRKWYREEKDWHRPPER